MSSWSCCLLHAAPTHVDSVPRVRAQFPRGGPSGPRGDAPQARRGSGAAPDQREGRADRADRGPAHCRAFARSLRPANVRQPPGRPRAGARRRARAYAAVSGCRASAAYVARRPQSDRRGAQTLAVAEIAPSPPSLPPCRTRGLPYGHHTVRTHRGAARTEAQQGADKEPRPSGSRAYAEGAPTWRALAYLVTVVAMRRMPRTYLCRNHEVVQKAVPAGGSSSPAHRPRSCRTRTESVNSPPIPLRSRPSSRAIILHHSTSHSEPAQPPDRRAAA